MKSSCLVYLFIKWKTITPAEIQEIIDAGSADVGFRTSRYAACPLTRALISNHAQ